MSTSNYFIWERSDGHIGVSTFMPSELQCVNGKTLTFIKHAEAATWNEALSAFSQVAKQSDDWSD